MANVHVGSVMPIALRAARCVVRTSTERPEALDKACFTLAGIDEDHVGNVGVSGGR